MAQWRGVVKKRPWANGDVMSGAPNKIRSLESAERGKEIRFSIVLQLLSTTNVMKTIKRYKRLQSGGAKRQCGASISSVGCH